VPRPRRVPPGVVKRSCFHGVGGITQISGLGPALSRCDAPIGGDYLVQEHLAGSVIDASGLVVSTLAWLISSAVGKLWV
jgi:hypothetical protein